MTVAVMLITTATLVSSCTRLPLEGDNPDNGGPGRSSGNGWVGSGWEADPGAATPTTSTTGPTSGPVVVRDRAAILAEADWILSAQLGNGALASHADRGFVDPYLASFAILGLGAAFSMSGDSRYREGAWAALEWYANAQDYRGVVTDWEVVDGQLISTGGYDSTDAYAGMFLLAAGTTMRVAPDRERLSGLAGGIDGAVRAIELTLHHDGTTDATPEWPAAYLMDQAEVYGGLRAGAELARALGSGELEAKLTRYADQLRATVATWDNGVSLAVAYNRAGATLEPADLSRLFPDSLAQVWAARFGLVSDQRAEELTSGFASSWPQWTGHDEQVLGADGMGRVGYLAVPGWNEAGDEALAERLQAHAVARGRAWEYNVGIAGQLLVLAHGWVQPGG